MDYKIMIYHRPGSEVIHKVGVSEKGLVLFSCRYKFIERGILDEGLHNLPFHEDSLEVLRKEMDIGVYALCSHCKDREPSWKRKEKELKRKERKKWGLEDEL